MDASNIYLQKLKKEEYIRIYRFMILMRRFDNAAINLYKQRRIVGGIYSGMGNEATAIGSAYALEKSDYLFPMLRDSGAHFVKGQSAKNIMLQLDKNCILNSVRKPGKVLIVREDNLTGCIGAEIAAIINEYAFEFLNAPIMHVASLDTPVPYSPTLESNFLPDENNVTIVLKNYMNIN